MDVAATLGCGDNDDDDAVGAVNVCGAQAVRMATMSRKIFFTETNYSRRIF